MKGSEGTYQVLAARETSRQIELVGHVDRPHDLVGPLSINVVELVDLEPASAHTSGGRSIVDRAEEHVGDWARVSRAIPLHLDAVALAGLDGLDNRRSRRHNVAGDVVARHVGDWAVGRRHPNADLVAGRLIVYP